VRLPDIKLGGKDDRGLDILGVLWDTNDYKIYRHADGISPHFSDDSNNAARQRAAYARIRPSLSLVNALRATTALHGKSIDREIAGAISACLEGDPDSAERTLANVHVRLQNLRTIEGRLQYQIGSLIAAVIVGLLCLVAWFSLAQEATNTLSVFRLASVGAFGALGGLLSVAIGINKVTIDPDADRKINILSGASRIVIAVIGSVLVYMAVVSKLVLANLNLTDSAAGIFTIAMVAGFSETFVPNILGRLASAADSRREHSQTEVRSEQNAGPPKKV
jgi:hypothetical protein